MFDGGCRGGWGAREWVLAGQLGLVRVLVAACPVALTRSLPWNLLMSCRKTARRVVDFEMSSETGMAERTDELERERLGPLPSALPVSALLLLFRLTFCADELDDHGSESEV